MERKRNFILRWLILASVEMVVKANIWGRIFSSQSPSSSPVMSSINLSTPHAFSSASAVLSPSVTSRIVASKSSLPSPSTPPVSPTTTPRVCRLRIHKGTSGVITFRQHFHASFPPTYCFKIVANKGEQIRLMLKVVFSQPWCDRSCSNCPYLEIENGIHENGKPSSRICGQLLNKVTLYSHFDQSLELLLATNVTGYMYVGFQASYTVTSYKETVSNECSNYKFLNESNRAMTYVNRSIGNLCDSALSGWYRFSGEAGTQMADSCPKIYHCSTDSPGWLNGTHPTVAEGIVQRKVCFFQQLFVSDCCYSSKNISVRNCGAFYVYRLDPPKCYSRYCGNGLPRAPECSNYKFLNDSSRAATYRLDGLTFDPCKHNYYKSGWYRFGGETGNQMADTCVKMCHCGAPYPGWLTGGHPSVEDGAVMRKVCFVGRRGCCEAWAYITVRNCSGFYVYHLSRPSSYCNYGYCASTGFEEPTTLTTERSRQRFLNGTNGTISFSIYYQECTFPHYSWQIAAKKGEKVTLVIQHLKVLSWDTSCTFNYVEIQNGTYADGKPSTRMCGEIVSGIVTFYSHENHSLKVVLVIEPSSTRAVFEATYTVHSYNESVSNECSNYKFLSESNRAMTHANRSIGKMCDSVLSGWYRFSGEAGTQMADSCPKMYHCSTDSPGWLNGTHPTVAEGIVQRKVCFFEPFNGSYCCAFSKTTSVRNCGAFYVYRLDPPDWCSRYCGNGLPQAPECSNYKALKEANQATYRLNPFSLCKNESTLSGWYRFDGEAGNQMADTCFERYHCGARYPGWLSGGHPSVEDGAVVRRVCFNGYHSCCEYFVYISVRNCGGFYVYKLTPFPTSYRCIYRYCASNGTKLALPTTLTTEIWTSSAAQTTTVPSFTSSPAQTTTVPSTIFCSQRSPTNIE